MNLSSWFLRNKRSFPWRDDPTPYRVWISEIMLQQTLASVVVAYFERWMERFPTVFDLAKASEDEVIKGWEGLGYYSRARNIHKMAKILVERYGGQLPSTREELEELPGLGPYTVGAILSFAFQQKQAAVDGNVLRVMARFFAIEEEIDQPKVQKGIRALTQEFLPNDKPHIAMEALIELGATLCGKTPQCTLCPLRSECRAHKLGIEQRLPLKRKRPQTTHLYRFVPIITCGAYTLVRRAQEGEIMQGLCEFPYIELSEPPKGELDLLLEKTLGVKAAWQGDLERAKHSFTRFCAHLFASLWECEEMVDVAGCDWLTHKEIEKASFSSGHRRLLNQWLCKNF